MFVSVCGYAQTSLAPPSGYDKVETSYTQTTISQDVVFNSTMQAGGTLIFTVNATSGGGHTGASEPVSLSLVFYNSSGGIVNTVNSSTTELPTPSAGWVTENVSATNCGGSCANVAYVQVQMHGIDGSYWAGDYGPQYYGPSLTFNGGGNILYNPQFGPAPNGTNVQGWNSTAGWGVCQGAYGGSNDCVNNYTGVTANGGNYVANGGTSSSQPGGYTITSSGSTAGLSGIKFGAAQVADAQWNVYACTQTTTCQIYSTNPGVTYNTTSPTYIGTGQYISFTANTGSDSATNPWTMILYNSDGSVAKNLGTGHILIEGTDSSGNSYFFFSNSSDNGTLFSGNLGLSGQGATFTGTPSPSVSDTNTFSGSMSTSPLAAGQTGGSTSSSPTVTSTSTTDVVTTSSTTGATTTTTNQYLFDNQTYNVIGTSTPTTVTTTTTPVTTTNYSDGTSTTTNGTATSTSTTTYSYTVTGPAQQPTSPYIGTNTSGVYITQSGSGNNTGAYQSGRGNYMEIKVSGNSNTVSAGQGYTFNTIGVASESLTPSNYNVLGLTLSGNSNTVVSSQVGLSNSAIINISGGTNTVTVNQTGNNNQEYNIINGSGNALSVSQTGNGHIAAANLYGNGNTASITQNGSAPMGAVLNLTNAGGANNVIVTQTGSTTQAYSLQQTCTTPSGCNVTVTQGH